MASDTQRRETLLTDALRRAQATLHAIDAGDLLSILPARERDHHNHNMALGLLDMLADSLRSTEAALDALDAAEARER